MTDRRLDAIEQRLTPDAGAKLQFTITAPPPGLSADEDVRWREAQRLEGERQGVYSFTLDLGRATIRDSAA
jgi:hypothetical protein